MVEDHGFLSCILVQFHPWNDTLLTIDDRSVGHVWNHAKGMKIREFPLHSSKFEATSALWLNEHSDPLLAIGYSRLISLRYARGFVVEVWGRVVRSRSSNGIVRVYQGVGDISSELRLVTAFTGMPEMGASMTGSGLIMEVRLSTGDYPHLRFVRGYSTPGCRWNLDPACCTQPDHQHL
jgi:hypothetical protein